MSKRSSLVVFLKAYVHGRGILLRLIYLLISTRTVVLISLLFPVSYLRKIPFVCILVQILLDTSCHSVSAIMKGGNHVSGTKRHEGNASRQENLHGGRSRSHFGYRQNLRIYSCQRGAFQNRANQRSMHLIHERTPRHPLSKLLFYLMLRCRERNCLQLIFEHIGVSLNRRTQIAEPVHSIVISLLCVFANRFVTQPYCG